MPQARSIVIVSGNNLILGEALGRSARKAPESRNRPLNCARTRQRWVLMAGQVPGPGADFKGLIRAILKVPVC
jgi:hypothetical protein